MYNRGLNLKREREEQSEKDWKFGALSVQGIVYIPESERDQWLPKGETQVTAYGDFTNCASQSPCNHLEALFTYHYHHNMKVENKKWLEDNGYVQEGKITFSDRFVSINSGTTRAGNSLKAPLEAIRKQGLIPKKLLPKEDWMDFDSFHDPSKVTKAMRDLGLEFARRFTINYEQVSISQFAKVLKDDLVGVAGNAWPKPVNGVYPPTDSPFNHAFLLYKLPKYQVFDSYLDFDPATGTLQVPDDFTKNLDPEYKFYEYGYRVYLSKEISEKEDIQLTVFQILLKHGLLSFFADWWRRFNATQTPPGVPISPKPPVVPPPAQESPRERIHAESLLFIGTDASVQDLAPDRLACAESLSNVIHRVYPDFPIILSTVQLLNKFKKDPHFKATLEPKPGNIIISPTVGNTTGHCGIFGTGGHIMSNTSKTGRWETNYTLDAWVKYFRVSKGLRVFFFEPK